MSPAPIPTSQHPVRLPGPAPRPARRAPHLLPVMPMSSRRPAGTLALLVATSALAACGGGSGEAEAAAAAAAAAPMTVGTENVAVVGRDTVQSGPSISGSLAPEREATLRAEIGGTVTAALAEPGQRVGEGQVLARIETLGLTSQVASAQSGVAAAQAQYEVARRNAERSDRLLAAGAIAERDAEAARAQATAARAQVEAARSQLVGSRRQLGNATVAAPFGGIVGLKSVSTGDVVSPGTALYTVVDPRSMQLEASVPADQLSQVRVGAPVRFTVTGYPDRQFLGKITRVAPVADPATRQVRIIASLPNAGNALVGGLFAEGRVSAETRSALVVPADAIDQRGVRPAVVRVKGGKVERVNVELGLRDDAREAVEIRAGVALGDTLLRGAAQGISTGTAVRVVAGPSDQAAAGATPVGAPAAGGGTLRPSAGGTGTGTGTGTGGGAGGATGSGGGGAAGPGATGGTGGTGGGSSSSGGASGR